MKRLAFCFDGTWNRLDAVHATNVVLTAEIILPFGRDGIVQSIFYDEGVGTRKYEKIVGGLFGSGMVENLGDAYRFLIFNYTLGDEIFIFVGVIRELSAAVILFTSETKVLSVLIFDLKESGDVGAIAVLSLTMVILTTVVIVIANRIGGIHSRSTDRVGA